MELNVISISSRGGSRTSAGTKINVLVTTDNDSQPLTVVTKDFILELQPTRNEITEEIQWQKQSSGKKNKNESKKIYIENLSLDTKIDDLYELFGLRSTKYLRETCKINMPVNESTETCKGFAFALVPEQVQKQILKLNRITLENRIIVIEDTISTRKRDTNICKKLLNVPL